MTRPHPPGQTPARTLTDTITETVVAVGVAVLVVIGFTASYDTLRVLAVTDGGFPAWLAPAVPLSFDLGIVVLSLRVVTAAREGRHALTLRALIVALSAVTVAVNGAASHGISGQLLHAVPPAMFVICFETVIATARRHALADQPATHSPVGRRAAAWLLEPRASCRRWRSHILSDTANAAPPGRPSTPPSAAAAAPRRVAPSRHGARTGRLEAAR